MFESILVVCRANVCRSPVAEALLKFRMQNRKITSAGLSVAAMEGQGVAPVARQLAEADGLDLSSHQAKRIDREMIETADLILTMTEDQRRAIGERSPTAIGKTLLFGHWLEGGGAQGVEIPDPYRKSREAYAHVHRLLVKAADEWQRKLN